MTFNFFLSDQFIRIINRMLVVFLIAFLITQVLSLNDHYSQLEKQFDELILQEGEQEKQIVDLHEKILFLSEQSISSLDTAGIGETRKEIIDLKDQITEQTTKLLDWSESQEGREEKIVSLVKSASASVVSIMVNDFSEEEKGELLHEGTGFIVSSKGLVLTNKHLTSREEVEYSIVDREGEVYSAKVLARDPFQDLAFLQIQEDNNLPVILLGDSSDLASGQTVVAIGNALGEFENTVSVGVISGLSRTVSASGGGVSEILNDLIQTDTAINRGNSGGPLLNLSGEVIGINVAMAERAENIGFAIPINRAQRDIKKLEEKGEIVYPFLGIRYISITSSIQEEENLPVSYGALIRGNDQGSAILEETTAVEMGLKENDIILEANGQKIDKNNPLYEIIQDSEAGDVIILRILRQGEETNKEGILGEKRDA
jgi:serine protease Do